jgi:hypothetical protein
MLCLLGYLHTYLLTIHLLIIYLHAYLITYYLPIYLSIYQPTTYEPIIYLCCVFLNLDSYSLYASFFKHENNWFSGTLI